MKKYLLAILVLLSAWQIMQPVQYEEVSTTQFGGVITFPENPVITPKTKTSNESNIEKKVEVKKPITLKKKPMSSPYDRPELAAHTDLDMEELESGWANSRKDFLSDKLFLDEDSILEIKNIGLEFGLSENKIFEKDIDIENEEMFVSQRENLLETRRVYEFKLAELMGEDNWESYLEFYRKYWQIGEKTALNKTYQPLK